MKTELAIIGAGPGGYAAAFYAADKGMQVTLIDPEANPGGVCLYRGCIPSKALLHIARVINEARESKNFGVTFEKPKIDLERVREWKNEVVKKLTDGLGQLSKQRKVNYVRGLAKFIDSNSLEIYAKDKKERLEFEKAIVATGSIPNIPNSLTPLTPLSKRGDDEQNHSSKRGNDEENNPSKRVDDRLMDSTSALEIESVPESLLVIGGGYIGLELGTVYAALGTKVSIVEMLPELLSGVDRDLVSVLTKRLEGIFESIMLNTKVSAIKEEEKGLRVKFEGETKNEHRFHKVLIAAGRVPNTKGIGLENTGVKLDDKGFIKVNEHRRTDDDSIFAIGDAAGQPMLAHKAAHEGMTAVEAIAGEKTAFEPRAIPAVVFTDPEIAWCGLTETQAKAENRKAEVAKFPWAASGRAATLGRTDGLTKLIIEPESERILGVGIAGTGAGELIAEGVLAIEMGANARDIKMTIHPHPTLTETLMETAEGFFGLSTHIYRPKKK